MIKNRAAFANPFRGSSLFPFHQKGTVCSSVNCGCTILYEVSKDNLGFTIPTTLFLSCLFLQLLRLFFLRIADLVTRCTKCPFVEWKTLINHWLSVDVPKRESIPSSLGGCMPVALRLCLGWRVLAMADHQ